MKIKVYEGTTRTDQPFLCKTCKSASFMKGAYSNEPSVFCNIIDRWITTRIVECSDYRNETDISLTDMRDMAYVLNITKSGKPIGFLNPKEAKNVFGDYYDLPGE